MTDRFLDSGVLDPWDGWLENLEGRYGAILRGLPIGHGTDWTFQDATNPFGAYGGADYRVGLSDNIGHGATIIGRTWLEPKPIVFALITFADTQAEALERLDALNLSYGPAASSDPLTLELFTPNGAYYHYGIPHRPVVADITRAHHGVILAVASFLATDPRAYSTEVARVDDTVNIAAGGLDIGGHGFPHAFGGGANGARIALNAGTADAPWRLIVVATTDLDDITIDIGGRRLIYTLPLEAGQALTIDSATRSIIETPAGAFGPAINRSADLLRPGSRWGDIAPGETTVAVNAATGTGLATLAFRPAYLF